jgi:hypothetical protein
VALLDGVDINSLLGSKKFKTFASVTYHHDKSTGVECEMVGFDFKVNYKVGLKIRLPRLYLVNGTMESCIPAFAAMLYSKRGYVVLQKQVDFVSKFCNNS